MKRFSYMALGMILPLALASCNLRHKSTTPVTGVGLTSPETLASRLVKMNSRISLDAGKTLVVSSQLKSSKKADKPKPALTETVTFIGEINPPVVGRVTLQATGIALRGNHAYVSYNERGAPYAGAVQILEFGVGDSVSMVSEAIFYDRDINGLTVCGNRLYMAMASQSSESASVGYIDLTASRQIPTKPSVVEVKLEGFAANSIRCSDSAVVVSHGDKGGVSIFDRSLTTPNRVFIPIQDSRSVDFWGNEKIAVLNGATGPGKSGELTLIRTGVAFGNITVGGATIPESKSDLEIVGDIAFTAMNDGGVRAVRLTAGNLIFSIPPPTLEGHAAETTVSNSVAVDGDLIFIASGEAGVYVGKFVIPVEKEPDSVSVLGAINLGPYTSANDVKFRNGKLLVAAGGGGVKIFSVVGADGSVINPRPAEDETSTDVD